MLSWRLVHVQTVLGCFVLCFSVLGTASAMKVLLDVGAHSSHRGTVATHTVNPVRAAEQEVPILTLVKVIVLARYATSIYTLHVWEKPLCTHTVKRIRKAPHRNLGPSGFFISQVYGANVCLFCGITRFTSFCAKKTGNVFFHGNKV